MARIKTYPVDDNVTLDEKMLASDSDAGHPTKNIIARDLWALFNEQGNGIDFRYNDIEDAVSIYDYHGGVRFDGVWIVIRYLKSDVTQRTVATQISTPFYTNIDDAWINRATLNYS